MPLPVLHMSCCPSNQGVLSENILQKLRNKFPPQTVLANMNLIFNTQRHLRLPNGLDESRVGEVERAGNLLRRKPLVDPLLPQVRIRLVVLEVVECGQTLKCDKNYFKIIRLPAGTACQG